MKLEELDKLNIDDKVFHCKLSSYIGQSWREDEIIEIQGEIIDGPFAGKFFQLKVKDGR